METTHKMYYESSKNMKKIGSDSIDLIVTSPPYPMIEMWDDTFSSQDSFIEAALNNEDGNKAFDLMHKVLDSVWDEAFRVLKNGGFACINIGDATRSIKGSFSLYPNHVRILEYLRKIGFTVLPSIIWRKQTNAPNKFMGSGMLPAGAYVTLEHEHILILRKGSKREFLKSDKKLNRKRSALFWEERNLFFSDIWFDIKGARQKISKPKPEDRARTGAFPFELAYRLVNMYSVKNDRVLDPFMGAGTSMAACMASGRNSLGFEIDQNLKKEIKEMEDAIVDFSNKFINERLKRHIEFVEQREKEKKLIKHKNEYYGFPVITNQEKFLILNELLCIEKAGKECVKVFFSEDPQEQYCLDRRKAAGENRGERFGRPEKKKTPASHKQMELF